MAHPNSNITGFTNFEFPMGAKWLELLKEVAPELRRVLVLMTPGNIGNEGFLRAINAAAPRLGVENVRSLDPRSGEFVEAVAALAREGKGGLLELPAAGLEQRGMIVRLAAQHRLPSIYALRPFIASGGLMSYDTDIADLYRRAASYVDRIVRGEKPGDLPVQVPTKYELVINLKAAKSMGLTVPQALLARADEVIE
jgi:putative ABC transport system substrate-binding protein